MVAVGTFEHIWLARLVQPLNLERLGYCENVVGAQAKEKSAYTINGKFGSLQTMISKMLTNFSTKSKSPVDPLKRLPILIWNECLPIFNTKKKKQQSKQDTRNFQTTSGWKFRCTWHNMQFTAHNAQIHFRVGSTRRQKQLTCPHRLRFWLLALPLWHSRGSVGGCQETSPLIQLSLDDPVVQRENLRPVQVKSVSRNFSLNKNNIENPDAKMLRWGTKCSEGADIDG